MFLKKQLKLVFGLLRWLFQAVGLLFIFFVLLRIFVLHPFLIDGNSMEPNFHNNEYLLVDTISYKFREPRRGEVIVFHPPHKSDYYIKRIIALPGEKVVIKEGRIYISNKGVPTGLPLSEPYLPPTTETAGEIVQTLHEDEYFVLGDNRDHSVDSREFGVVPRKNISGRAFFVFLPFSNFGFIHTVSYPQLESTLDSFFASDPLCLGLVITEGEMPKRNPS